MAIERAIQCAMFILMLAGLFGISAWASYSYLSEAHPVLEVAVTALSWGVILLFLYVSFKKLEWNWWS
ncbi:MAG: hypothetical protein ACPLKQ_02275 [Candidatus Bathyarchaeales archaeon]